MSPKIIEGYSCVARNLSDTADIEYKLWVDKKGGLCVQLVGSSGGGNVNTSMLFPISDNLDLRKSWNGVESLKGFDINKEAFTETTGENNILFLAAVLRELLPD